MTRELVDETIGIRAITPNSVSMAMLTTATLLFTSGLSVAVSQGDRWINADLVTYPLAGRRVLTRSASPGRDSRAAL